MTAREACDCDSTFRALVHEWVRERRCPVPLVDRCIELDLEGAADCARWAATEPIRPQFLGEVRKVPPSGPYPSRNDDGLWYWSTDDKKADYAPSSRINAASGSGAHRESALDTILWLLDAWVPEPADAAA